MKLDLSVNTPEIFTERSMMQFKGEFSLVTPKSMWSRGNILYQWASVKVGDTNYSVSCAGAYGDQWADVANYQGTLWT
jgi:hypothetical protein